MMKKLIVGLTGIFGSGKSTAAHLFEELGATVISADQLAHESLWKDSPIYDQVKVQFPEVSETSEGLDRKALGAIVFRDENRLRKLEALIHPYVRQRMESEIVDAETDIVILEVPLLFEAEFHWLCDVTIAVQASRELIHKRLQEKGFASEEVNIRHQAQMPLEEKVRRADFTISNEKSLKETKEAVEKLWKKLKQKSQTSFGKK